MNNVKLDIDKVQNNNFVNSSLDYTNRMIAVMEEIKCRLGMNLNNEGNIPNDEFKIINIPTYKVEISTKSIEIKMMSDIQSVITYYLTNNYTVKNLLNYYIEEIFTYKSHNAI